MRIDIQPIQSLPLAEGKGIIQTSYAFGFDSEDYVGGGGVGKVKETYGDLMIKTALFPMVVINHALNKQLSDISLVMLTRESGAGTTR